MRRLILTMLLGVTAPGSVFADEICFTVEVPMQPTAWQQIIVLPQFGGPGMLESLSLQVDGHIEGSAGVENTTAVPATTNVQWSAQVDLLRTNGSSMVGASPSLALSDDLAAFDGTVDFAGASGVSHPGMAADAGQVVHIGASSPDFGLFLGSGSVLLFVRSLGTSAASPGTTVSIGQQASATVTICYVTDSIQSYCTSTPNSTGAPATISWSGSSSLAGGGLTLTAAPVPADAFGMVVCSPDQAQIPLGDGYLCLGTDTLGHVVRLTPLRATVTGEFTYLIQPSQPANRSAHFLPGSTWNFQVWFRDRGAGPGARSFNFSDGLEVTFGP